MRQFRRISRVVSFAVSLSASVLAAPPQKSALNLGDATADLLYTPLAPCRIIDTRLTPAGMIAAGTSRDFMVAGTTGFDTQGGTAGGCGVPHGAMAVAVNFVAVSPQGVGNLKGSAFPNPIPATGSIVNYQALTPALNIANAVPFPICGLDTCSADITLFANVSATHVVADVVGYYSPFPIAGVTTPFLADAAVTAQKIGSGSAPVGSGLTAGVGGTAMWTPVVSSVASGTGIAIGGTPMVPLVSIAPSGVGTTELATGAVTLQKISTSGAGPNQVPLFNGSSMVWQPLPGGTITGVTAGTGLTGGGTSGAVTVSANLLPQGSLSGFAPTLARSDHSHYARTIIVNSGGATTADNGTALLNAIQSISDNSATNPYLLKLEPGTYDIGTQLLMKPYVDIEGSGGAATVIRRQSTGGVLFGADGAQIRQLTITGVSSVSSIVAVGGNTTTTFDDVKMFVTAAAGGNSFALDCLGTCVIRDSMLSASGGVFANALTVRDVGTVEVTGSTFTGSDGTSAVYTIDSQGAFTGENIHATATNATSGGAYAFTNEDLSTAKATIRDSSISSTSASGESTGILNGGSLSLSGSTVSAGATSTGQTWALRNSGSSGTDVVSVEGSRLVASGATPIGVLTAIGGGTMIVTVEDTRVISGSGPAIYNVSGTTRVANSRLDGAGTLGTMQCVYVYDGNFNPYVCP